MWICSVSVLGRLVLLFCSIVSLFYPTAPLVLLLSHHLQGFTGCSLTQQKHSRADNKKKGDTNTISFIVSCHIENCNDVTVHSAQLQNYVQRTSAFTLHTQNIRVHFWIQAIFTQWIERKWRKHIILDGFILSYSKWQAYAAHYAIRTMHPHTHTLTHKGHRIFCTGIHIENAKSEASNRMIEREAAENPTIDENTKQKRCTMN